MDRYVTESGSTTFPVGALHSFAWLDDDVFAFLDEERRQTERNVFIGGVKGKRGRAFRLPCSVSGLVVVDGKLFGRAESGTLVPLESAEIR